ncbi:MAG: ATP synthase F1 subunit gamma [Butyrivibrio sp.]|nr:ATP synthase F1 subunit gamma [Butyrivibrio sp.]
MANIKEIRDRISSIEDTMKITNAMYMISSNKLRKARKRLEETEPYFFGVQNMINRTLRHIDLEMEDVFLETHSDIPFMSRKKGYVVITDDKGLAGAYNHNVLKLAEDHIKSNNDNDDWKLYVIGELGRQYFISKGMNIDETFRYTAQNPTMSRSRKITASVLDDYMEHKIDEVYVVYTTMKNSMTCEAQITKLLPLDMLQKIKDIKLPDDVYREEFYLEPSPQAVIDNIVPNYVNGFFYGAMVEAYCSVQNSRMMAMDAANKSAQEMIGDLRLQYNRQRQAMITQEITEVAGGARALKQLKKKK